MNDLNQIGQAIEQIADSFDAFKATVDRRFEQIDTRTSRPGAGASEHRGAAYHPDADKTLLGRPTREQRAALGRWLRTGEQAAFDLAARTESRARVNITAPADGSNAVIPWLNPEVQTQALAENELLSRVRTRQVTNFPARTLISTTAGFEWVAEAAIRNETTAPQPKLIEIQPGEWSAKPCVSNWALQDIQFDAEAWLMSELRLAYANALMAAIIAGNGVAKPRGILDMPTADTVAPALGTIRRFVTGQAATLPTTAATMITLLSQVSGSVAWQYRQGSAWYMNASTLEAIRAVRDDQNRPLFIDSLVTRGAQQLLGYDVVEVEAMPNVGAGALPIIFGNLNAGYMLATDSGMQLTRDAITEPGFTKFYTRTRVGGSPTDTAALRVVRVSAT
jgi:HK97 family phage major capsid protein